MMEFSEDILQVLVDALDESMVSEGLQFPAGFEYIIDKRGDRFLKVLIGNPLCKHLIEENLANPPKQGPLVDHLDSAGSIELLATVGSIDTPRNGRTSLTRAINLFIHFDVDWSTLSDKIAALLIAGANLYHESAFLQEQFDGGRWELLVAVDNTIKAAKNGLVKVGPMKVKEKFALLLQGYRDEGSALQMFHWEIIMDHIYPTLALLSIKTHIYEMCRGLCPIRERHANTIRW